MMLLLIIFLLYCPEELDYLLDQESVQNIFKSKTFNKDKKMKLSLV